MKEFKRSILFFDSFKAPANLRINGDSQVSNICSGCFSFLLICCFVYVFAIKSYEVFIYKHVTSNSVVQDKIYHKKSGQIMVAMRILQQKDSLQKNKYFEFYAKHVPFWLSYDEEEEIKSEQIQFCKLQQWEGVDQKLLVQHYDIEKWLCPKFPMKINGLQSQPGSSYINLKIDYCLFVNWCTHISQIISYLSQQKKYYGYLTAEFLILDTTFTLFQENPVAKMPTYIKAPFTDSSGIVVDVMVAQYVIETDESMLPWEDKQIEKGVYIYSSSTSYSQYDKDWSYLIQFNMKFIAKTMKAQRQFGKIDNMLSYAGGLFGIIIGFFGFFLLSYNQYKYELTMAESVFICNNKNDKIGSKSFNFFVYIKYCIFQWIKQIFGLQMNWEYYKKIDQTRKEAISQMNISFILKKIYYLQKICRQMITQEQARCFSVIQHPTIQEAKINRLCLSYYEEITKEKVPIILADIYPQNSLSKQTKKIFIESLQISRLAEVIKNYCKKYPRQFIHLDEAELDDEQKLIEKNLADAFFNLSDQSRAKIQGSLPLLILYLIFVYKSQIQQVSNLYLINNGQKMQSSATIINKFRDIRKISNSFQIQLQSLEQ